MFCQNWEIAQAPRLGLDIPQRRLSPEQIVENAVRAGARSIAYTYVEPTVFLEYALDTGRLARRAGLRNLFVTDGYATPEAVSLLAEVLDAANVDLKSFDDAFYRRLCGARLAHVLDAIVAYRDAGIWLELTTLVIPGRNDGDDELRALADWIAGTLGPDTPWHVSRFHPAFRMRDVPPTPIATLRRAAEIGREAGLRYVYVGNAPELQMEDTRCAGCGLAGRRAGRLPVPVGAGPRWGVPGVWSGRPRALGAGDARRGGIGVTGSVRSPAVAGPFYPGSPGELRRLVDALFAAAARLPGAPAGDAHQWDLPIGILVPHAGLVYSGIPAAAAWACLRPAPDGPAGPGR